MEEYETVLLVKNEVFVYNIPPRQSTTRGYRASDWNLGTPDWTGRMRVVAKLKSSGCTLKLEDKITGELFAKCPIDTYPGLDIQAVSDSSRYFVIHIKDDSGKAAYIGIGFADRSDSFDLNVALQDHFKWIKKTASDAETAEDPGPQLDLKFKEGQTINIKMNLANPNQPRNRPKQGGPGLGILPPPPGGVKLPPPPGGAGSPSHRPAGSDLLAEFGGTSAAAVSPSNPFASTSGIAGGGGGDEWGDFSGASSTNSQPAASQPAPSNWVQF